MHYLFEYCENYLGTPTAETKEENMFHWKTSDGNVTLLLAGIADPRRGAVARCLYLLLWTAPSGGA